MKSVILLGDVRMKLLSRLQVLLKQNGQFICSNCNQEFTITSTVKVCPFCEEGLV